ncbi:MAG: hypothetical protein U9M92_00990 [Patescibacteria group bacterium]|nr:hypothetical protein [Patescibacteria group bacterium]
MKTLAIFRDLMPTKMALPILNELRKRGNTVFAITEGQAAAHCKQTRAIESVLLEGNNSLAPVKSSEITRILGNVGPDVLIIGCSCPINWELQFAKVARRRGIPVVAIEDIWGDLSRLGDFIPDLALTIDNLGHGTRAGNSQAIGDIASAVNPAASNDAQEQVNRLEALARDKTTVLIVADHTSNALEIVELVAKSVRLEEDPGQFVITHSLVHPKLTKTEAASEILRPAEQLLAGLTVDQFGGLSTDTRAVHCHYTVAAFTTPLRIALHNGRRAVSVSGPKSLELLWSETGFRQYPLVALEAIPEMNQPASLSNYDWESLDRTGRAWAERARFRPEAGAAIESLVTSWQ